METTTIVPIGSRRRTRREFSRACVLALDGLVPGAPHGADQLRRPELAAQLRDVDVHGARPARVGEAPHLVEQALARENDAGVLDERDEEIELLRRQLDDA